MTEQNSIFPKINIDISALTIVKILLVIIAAAFLYFIRDMILIIFVALILASALTPWIDWLERKRLPRALGILLIYLIFFTIAFSAVYLIIPPISVEISNLAKDFPTYWEKINAFWQNFQNLPAGSAWNSQIQNSFNSWQFDLNSAATNVFDFIASFFGGLAYLVIALFLIFFIVVKDKALKKSLSSLLPPYWQPYIIKLINRLQEKIGLWLRGQLLLSLIIFFITLIGLSLIGVKYALVLALFSAVAEFIPYLGSIIAGILAAIIAFNQAPLLGLIVLIFYLVLHESEGYFISPLVMKKVTGLNPITVIIAMLIGTKLVGFLGIILAVPVTTSIKLILEDYLPAKKDL